MKKWLHNLLKGMSLTAALFVFQACYGTPAGYPDAWEEVVGPATEAVAEDPEEQTPEAQEPELEVIPEEEIFLFR